MLRYLTLKHPVLHPFEVSQFHLQGLLLQLIELAGVAPHLKVNFPSVRFPRRNYWGYPLTVTIRLSVTLPFKLLVERLKARRT